MTNVYENKNHFLLKIDGTTITIRLAKYGIVVSNVGEAVLVSFQMLFAKNLRRR